MLPKFNLWREMGGAAAGTPAVGGGTEYPDANIQGAQRNGRPQPQKSANWFKSPPKLHGTPPGPKGLKANEMAGAGGAPGLDGSKGNFNVWGAQPNGKPFPQHMKKKLKRESAANPADLAIAKELLRKENEEE
jgi:hypothetical protein